MQAYEKYIQARRLMAEGQFEKAAILLEQNIKDNPHSKELELLGECFIKLGRLTEAIVPLAAASTLNGGVRAPSYLAEVLLLIGDIHDASRIVEIALNRDPMNRKALRVKEQIANTSYKSDE